MIKETRVPVPMKPGQEARVDFEYERYIVPNIFLAAEPFKGKCIWDRFELYTLQNMGVG